MAEFVPGLSPQQPIAELQGQDIMPNPRTAEIFNRLLRQVRELQERVAELEATSGQGG